MMMSTRDVNFSCLITWLGLTVLVAQDAYIGQQQVAVHDRIELQEHVNVREKQSFYAVVMT